MKKIFLMTCAAAMIIAAGNVCAAQQNRVPAVSKTAVVKVTEETVMKEAPAAQQNRVSAVSKTAVVKGAEQKALKESCKVGSHVSHQWIKERNKNCTKCGTQKDSKGQKVFYCYCDCAKEEQPELKCQTGYTISVNKKTGKKTCVKDQHAQGERSEIICPRGYDIAVNEKTGKKSCSCAGYVLFDKTCVSCPKNATCNGKTATCTKGYSKAVNKSTGKTVCECAGYMTTGNKCTECPANATCNGKTAKCKVGFTNVNDQKDGGVVRCEVLKRVTAK